jgi:hypothetical protein
MRLRSSGLAFYAMLAVLPCPAADDEGTRLAPVFAHVVDRRLDVPDADQRAYAGLLDDALAQSDLSGPQYVLLIDRSEFVQAAMPYWMGPDGDFLFIGASPVSTGKPGRFDHFITPLGVFEHTIANPDFRAEGTKNELGVRGYGRKGMRVFDFGWQTSAKGWGRGGDSIMRLQMHATDPALLENRVGTAQSKGCVRIPATLNVFLDRYGILDGDYEAAMAEGQTFWVLRPDRQPTPWSGRYLVVVDSRRTARPDWSPRPPH